jgi:hypothetical protein
MCLVSSIEIVINETIKNSRKNFIESLKSFFRLIILLRRSFSKKDSN